MIGPWTDPCGTTQMTFVDSDADLRQQTNLARPLRYNMNQLSTQPSTPYNVFSHCRSMAWPMVSNATDRSTRVNKASHQNPQTAVCRSAPSELQSPWNDEPGKPTADPVADWPWSSSPEAADQQDAQAAWTAPTGQKLVGTNVHLPSQSWASSAAVHVM